jgi:ketopantoate hydroxymethyltransferase
MTKRDEEKEAAQDKERLHKEALAFKDKAKQAIKDHDEEVKLGAFPAPKK